MNKFFKIIHFVAFFTLFLASGNLNAQSKVVFRGNHTEYCCRAKDGTFSKCRDADYSLSYTVTITNNDIKLQIRYSDGEEEEALYEIMDKQFCAPDNTWYFHVEDEDGFEDIIGVGKEGDFLFFFDLDDDDNVCTEVFFLHD